MTEITSPTPYPRRLAALQAALEGAGIYAAVLSRPQHIFYYTGFQPGRDPTFLVVNPGGAAAVAPAALPGLETFNYPNYDLYALWSVPDNAAQALDEALSAANVSGRVVGIEEGYLPARCLAPLRHHITQPRDLTGLLWDLRKIRDAEELARIEANEAVNDQIFRGLCDQIYDGQSEFGVWAFLYDSLCRAAGQPIQLQADLGVGPRGVVGDAKPSLELLRSGDQVFVDIYTTLFGYHADTTRVFTVGRADAKQREIHALLLEAIAAGEERLRPGVRACDVDSAVRGLIAKAGYGPNFPHHSGHATNIFQQDKPYFIPAEPALLEAGMVVTLEPGVYLPGWGGMRLERNYYIGAEGPRALDQFPLDLAECKV